MAEGLEGRSSNPVAVLFDTLLHPDADFGFNYPPVLDWKLEPEHYIPHMVLGKGPPGGAWHVRTFSILLLEPHLIRELQLTCWLWEQWVPTTHCS